MAISTGRVPIAPALVADHLDRLATALDQADADGLLVFRNTNILAFCGVPLGPSDRLVCGLINRQGQVGLILPGFEASAAHGLPPGGRSFTWEEHQDPYAVTADAAASLGIAEGRLLLDGRTWIGAQERLRRRLPKARLELDTGLIESVRICKSTEEIAAIDKSCSDIGSIYRRIPRLLQEGLSELDLSRELSRCMAAEGLTNVGHLIQGGPSASVPHGRPGRRRFRDGDAVIIDLVCRREGYHGDMTRCFALGRVPDEVKQVYSIVREAQQAAIESVHAGAVCEEVDRAARSVIETAGLGDYFSHRLGHGIGLDVHEPPFLVQGNRQALAPGMCVTIEPGVYIPGRFGIRIEDVVAVTDDGCELLSDGAATDVSEFG